MLVAGPGKLTEKRQGTFVAGLDGQWWRALEYHRRKKSDEDLPGGDVVHPNEFVNYVAPLALQGGDIAQHRRSR